MAAAFYPLAYVAERVAGPNADVVEPDVAGYRAARPRARRRRDRGGGPRGPGRATRASSSRPSTTRSTRTRTGAVLDVHAESRRWATSGRRPALLARPAADGATSARWPPSSSWPRSSTRTTPPRTTARAARSARRPRGSRRGVHGRPRRLRDQHRGRLPRRVRLPGPLRPRTSSRSRGSPPAPSPHRPTSAGCTSSSRTRASRRCSPSGSWARTWPSRSPPTWGSGPTVLDPIEGLTDETADEDYLSLMEQNLDALGRRTRCR